MDDLWAIRYTYGDSCDDVEFFLFKSNKKPTRAEVLPYILESDEVEEVELEVCSISAVDLNPILI